MLASRVAWIDGKSLADVPPAGCIVGSPMLMGLLTVCAEVSFTNCESSGRERMV